MAVGTAIALGSAAISGINAIKRNREAKRARERAEREYKAIKNSDLFDSSKSAIEMAKGIHLSKLEDSIARGISERTGSAVNTLASQGSRGANRISDVLETANKGEREASAMFARERGRGLNVLAQEEQRNKAREQAFDQGNLAGLNQYQGEQSNQALVSLASGLRTLAAADWSDFGKNGGNKKIDDDGVVDDGSSSGGGADGADGMESAELYRDNTGVAPFAQPTTPYIEPDYIDESRVMRPQDQTIADDPLLSWTRLFDQEIFSKKGR